MDYCQAKKVRISCSTFSGVKIIRLLFHHQQQTPSYIDIDLLALRL